MNCLFQYFEPDTQRYQCLIGLRFRSKIPISFNYCPINNSYYLTPWKEQSIVTNPIQNAFELKIESSIEFKITSINLQHSGSYLIRANLLQNLKFDDVIEARECAVDGHWVVTTPYILTSPYAPTSTTDRFYTNNFEVIIPGKGLGITFQDKIRIDGRILDLIT